MAQHAGPCKECGRTFTKTYLSGRPPTYCSPKCAANGANRRGRARRAAQKAGPVVAKAPKPAVEAWKAAVEALAAAVEAPTASLQAPETAVEAPTATLQAPETAVEAPTAALQAPETVLEGRLGFEGTVGLVRVADGLVRRLASGNVAGIVEVASTTAIFWDSRVHRIVEPGLCINVSNGEAMFCLVVSD